MYLVFVTFESVVMNLFCVWGLESKIHNGHVAQGSTPSVTGV